MRENRTYGSEGGEGSALPDPYRTGVARAGAKPARPRSGGRAANRVTDGRPILVTPAPPRHGLAPGSSPGAFRPSTSLIAHGRWRCSEHVRPPIRGPP